MRALPIEKVTLPTSGNLGFGAQRSATHIHRGIDLPRPEGTAVYSAGDGIVEHASETWEQGFSGYGAHVVVRHPSNARSLYAHLSAVTVRPGESVLAGDRLGAVGRTEFTRDDHAKLLASGPHLHFEVSPTRYPQASEATRLDPVEWLAGAVDPRIAGAIASASRATGADLVLLRALAFVASGWNPAASSPRAGDVNALGLFGLLPDQLRLLGVSEAFSPMENALAGAKLLRSLLNRYGSIGTALAGYVWGAANVDRKPNAAEWPAAVEQWVTRVLDRYAVEQREGEPPPLVQRRVRDGARS